MRNNKGMELAIGTIAIIAIVLLVLIVVIGFFFSGFGTGSSGLSDIVSGGEVEASMPWGEKLCKISLPDQEGALITIGDGDLAGRKFLLP